MIPSVLPVTRPEWLQSGCECNCLISPIEKAALRWVMACTTLPGSASGVGMLLFNRRAFLKASVFSSAAISLDPQLFADDGQLAPSTKPQKIMIVGAGIAGLVAAFELMRSGHEVTVLEARMRPGGRIYTLRDSFADDLYAEAGAVDLGEGYPLLLRYVRELNLPLDEVPVAPKRVFFVQGRRYVVLAGQEPDWPYQLRTEERKLGQAGLWRKYVAPAITRIGDPSGSGWPSSSALQYDQTTFRDFLLKEGVSQEAVELFRFTLNGDDYDHLSALQSLLWEDFLTRNTTPMVLRGGNDQLPKAFARRLGERIHYGAAVTKIEQDAKKVRVTALQSGVQQQLEADRAIVAIPFSVLRKVELDSSFSPDKRRVISNLHYEDTTGVFLQSRRRFWSDQGIDGNSATDLPISLVVDHTATQPGSRGILQSQTESQAARRVWAMDPEARLRWTVPYMEQLHPGFAANFEGGTSFCWGEEPWSLGAWAYFAPGEMSTFYPHVARSEGRVYFAGEHTATSMTLEGAAASGLRAAKAASTA